MTWWGWLILGLIILGAEVVAVDAQFYLVFIGLSAALVGLSQLVGMSMPEWAQWTCFAALSLLSMFTFRKNLYEKIRGGAPGFKDSLVGETVDVDLRLDPGQSGRIQYRGTAWTVRNVGSTPIVPGTRAAVVETEGLELHVTAD